MSNEAFHVGYDHKHGETTVIIVSFFSIQPICRVNSFMNSGARHVEKY